MTSVDRNRFLPVTPADIERRGWDELDFLFISGDAYVDHPSFGAAIITRLLEDAGFRIGILAQPDWRTPDSFLALGKPRLGVLISSGVVESMVNHYTARKRIRRDDQYSPGGRAGFRPDRAVIVYTNRVREVMKDVPVIIGGIEASLRRFAHYDYWSDSVRRSILLDAKADLLVYGMGEAPILEIAESLRRGIPIREIRHVRGTAWVASRTAAATIPEIQAILAASDDSPRAEESERAPRSPAAGNLLLLPSFEQVAADRRAYARAHRLEYDEQDAIRGRTLIQPHGDRLVIQNPPAIPLNMPELDRVYGLPYARTWHPDYESAGGIPAIEEVRFSLTSHRGCFGGCTFCGLSFHQGRSIQRRSHDSILAEATLLTGLPDFKGFIHDVGGPTANFRLPSCEQQLEHGVCRGKECLFPEPCRKLTVDHGDYRTLLRRIRKLPGVKKVFIRSGLRFDYLMLDQDGSFFEELCRHHISGQLKVAPEHITPEVLAAMGKPGGETYDRFVHRYERLNKKLGLKQYLVPYLISGHPGSDLTAAIELAEYLRDLDYTPLQVQEFYPTPGTIATCMYYTGLDPRTMNPIHVPKSPREREMQRALLQFRKPENRDLVRQALLAANRPDLIGHGRKCLIKPTSGQRRTESRKGRKSH